MIKKIIFSYFFIILGLFAKPLEKVDLYIPPVGLGLLMVDAAQDSSLKKYAKKINVVRWNTPDQLRAGMLNGKIDVTFVPSYVGANFYNKGVKFQLMNILTGGILYIISTDSSIKSIEDLKNKSITVPFQNDMPDLVLKAMLKKKGIEKKVKIEYTPTPSVAVKLALAGKIQTLLLPEVAATKVQIMAKKKKKINYFRSIDITQEYGKIFKTKSYIPQAGVAVRESFANKNKDFVKALHKSLQKSAKKLASSPKRIEKMTNTVWKKQGKIFVKSFKYWNVDVRSAAEVKKELEFFYKTMFDLNPAIIGKKMPPSQFYLKL